MKSRIISTGKHSFTIIEVILAIGIFALVVGSMAGLIAQAFSLNRLGEEESFGNFLAIEGLEAARTIARRDYFNLVSGTYGLTTQNGFWEFAGSSQTFGKFTRHLLVSNVYRDGSGNIVSSGGTLDLFTKRVESRVTWNFAPTRNNEVSLKTYFTFWNEAICEWEDTADLTQVGGLNLPGNLTATDIEIEGDFGYVTGQSGGNNGEFIVVSLTNPINPQVSGVLSPSLNNPANGVAIVGSFAYLATSVSTRELLVLNISTPSNPTVTGFNGTPAGSALGVAATGDFAYLGVTNNGGPEFYIYNVTNPGSPSVVGSFEVGKDVSAVVVVGNRAYLAVTTTGTGQPNIIILDISNPGSPTQIGAYAVPESPSGAKGESVFYAGGILHLVIAGSASSPLYYLLDVSDPSNIAELGNLAAQGGMQAINDVEAGSGFALLATDKAAAAILIADIRNPSSPVKKLEYPLGGGANGLGAKINGCYAYVASSDNNQEIKVVAPAP